MKDLKGVPAGVTVVVVNWHRQNLTSVEVFKISRICQRQNYGTESEGKNYELRRPLSALSTSRFISRSMISLRLSTFRLPRANPNSTFA